MGNSDPTIPLDPDGMPVSKSMAWAVRHGDVLYLSGVVPVDDTGGLIGAGNPKLQAEACVNTIERILRAGHAGLADIIRATCFATNVEAARAYVAARAARVTHRPAATTVIVAELLVPGAMLEVEVIAKVSR